MMFSGFFDRNSGELVLPCDVLAEIVGESTRGHRFVAKPWFEAFSRDVFPLHVTEYNYRKGEARRVRPIIAPEITLAKFEMPKNAKNKVGFVSGQAISRRYRGINPEQQEEALRRRAQEYLESVDSTHPVYALAEYLNSHHECQKLTQKKNWDRVAESIFAMPHTCESEVCRKDVCIRVLYELDRGQNLYYTGSRNSPRLSAIGTSVHQLPREIRKQAFGGDSIWECDLKSSQLAVVAQRWGIASLQAFLEAGNSIWQELADTAGVPVDSCKPILKATIYSIVFGMGEEKLLAQLATGEETKPGIGYERARHVLRHPLLKEILKQRRTQMRLIKESDGWAQDAWGIWHRADWDDERNDFDVPALLAYVVQSWEMRVMLAMLPVLKAEKHIHCLSWLHDGVTLHLGDSTKVARLLGKIEAAVNAEAKRLGFATALDIHASAAL